MPTTVAARRRVRLKMRPEGDKIFRGGGLPGDKGEGTAGSVIMTQPSLCKVLVGGGAPWVTLFVAAGASADPGSPPECTTKIEGEYGVSGG